MEPPEIEPLFIGAGGLWPRQGEKPDPSVVSQFQNFACGPASAQMLLAYRGCEVDQRVIAEESGTPVGPGLLAQVMNDLVPALSNWQGGRAFIEGVAPSGIIERLCKTGSWAAILWDAGKSFGHMAIVDRISDDAQSLFIRDPWPPGTTYTMRMTDFLQYWTEQAIFWRAS